MRFRLSAFLIVACSIVACGDEVDMGGRDSGAGSSAATDSNPPGYKFDVFNAQLNGAMRPYESERRQPVIDALASLDSDVLCVTELWRDADKQSLADAARAKGFGYAYFPQHDLSTPVSDPTDQTGATPEQPTAAPCAASISAMNTSLDRVRDECVGGREDVSPDAMFSDCLTKKCIATMTGLHAADATCGACVSMHLVSMEPIGFIRDQCANNPSARLGFRGASGVMVLSRHPIVAPEVLVLPSTNWRQSVIRAPIQLSNGATVDYYCGAATRPLASEELWPYTGSYGGEVFTDNESKWVAELSHQAGRINTWVKSKSSRAIVAGDFYAGVGDETAGLEEQYPAAFQSLSAGLTLAAPTGQPPQCTQCPAQNALLLPPGLPLDMIPTTWTSLNLVTQPLVSDVTGAERILDEAVLDLGISTSGGKEVLAPLSFSFGFRSYINAKP